MRLAALIIGIFGSIAAFIGAVIALSLGGLGSALEVEEAETVVIGGWVALGMSIVGLTGAALSVAKGRVAALLMLISAVVGVIAISAAYAVGAVLFLIAACLAFLGREKGKETRMPPAQRLPASFCASCGSGLDVGARFCGTCGAETHTA